MYKPFTYQPDYNYLQGWDAFALDYAKLLQPDTVYTLTKEVMYSILEHHIHLKPGSQVLDVNCGTGNDFPYFLSKSCLIKGCDISTGMLNKAAETFHHQIESGKIELFQGALENMDTSTFKAQSFDLIYSITGGFSYIDDAELKRVFGCLGNFLKPNGKIITAHFGRFALAESLFYLARMKPGMAMIRRKRKIKVSIKQQHFMMHLQSHQHLSKLFSDTFIVEGIHPLLYFTPPYQTGYKPNPKNLAKKRLKELRVIHKKNLANFSDQFVVVLSKKNT